MFSRRVWTFVIGMVIPVSGAAAQHDMSMHAAAGSVPTSSGQAAFATISEVVRLLKADSATDWSKVDIEALRRHLIDMDAVTMRSPSGLHAAK